MFPPLCEYVHNLNVSFEQDAPQDAMSQLLLLPVHYQNGPSQPKSSAVPVNSLLHAAQPNHCQRVLHW
ncbi:hypothetical protein PAXRUDRAFT_21469 [Paxillus rubicundulus Ve08.2h10]|uniref:Uncharacterized protein n=1 Tax=Paxillus rubicundulus Ve08.2h10 TaxID=930991 RepID=A0A0D0BMQ3_9AGAM|nr:hypothetical protein PAXRUDRAFT_21469 [Paxillus rubicundulus Ve08.2h10]